MTTIEQLIGDLLLRHNCVIIPTFGGFVARQESAKINRKQGIITPPSKLLLFNKQLINNDGLLINELALQNNLSFEAASLEVKNTVAIWNEQLKNGGRIELDRVGLLFLDDERNICFEQDRFFNLLLESFGLTKIHFLTEEDVKIVEHRMEQETNLHHPDGEIKKVLKSVPTTDLQKAKKVLVADKTVEHPALRKNKSTVWRYVAAACLLPIAFYSIWIPVQTDVLESGIISLKDFNPFHSAVPAVYKPSKKLVENINSQGSDSGLQAEIKNLPSDKSHYTFKFDDASFINVSLPVKENSTAISSHEVSNTAESGIQPNGRNYIVGCFGDKENADNLVKLLNSKGLDAFIVDKNKGLHRVSAGSALSEEKMTDIAEKAKALGFSGWVLK